MNAEVLYNPGYKKEEDWSGEGFDLERGAGGGYANRRIKNIKVLQYRKGRKKASNLIFLEISHSEFRLKILKEIISKS